MILYKLIMHLLLPVVFLRMFWRGRKNPAYRLRWKERLGFTDKAVKQVIWVHAVSVGEAEAAAPLISALQQQYPDDRILITTTTPTGSDRVQKKYPFALHTYLPMDVPFAVKRFLCNWQPRVGIIMETEIWPNLILGCQQQEIPVVIANARLSEKSAAGYKRFSNMLKPIFGAIHVAARSVHDSEYFQQLGVSRVDVMGNIKLDAYPDPATIQAAEALREGFNRPLWVAASTHRGEDELLLAAHRKLLESGNACTLILVPRHPERFTEVARLIEKQGFSYQRFSNFGSCHDTDVLLGDTMGDLLKFFQLSDLAFIGGSLVETGGHNPYEALLYDAVVLTGPHVFNFTEAYAEREKQQAVVPITAQNLATNLQNLMQHPQQVQTLIKQGQSALSKGQGATAKLMQIIQSEIHEKPRA
jgi:3-deoxy-D-manno-octulosonic-acid transferase